jgi:hypothetical protein
MTPTSSFPTSSFPTSSFPRKRESMFSLDSMTMKADRQQVDSRFRWNDGFRRYLLASHSTSMGEIKSPYRSIVLRMEPTRLGRPFAPVTVSAVSLFLLVLSRLCQSSSQASLPRCVPGHNPMTR